MIWKDTTRIGCSMLKKKNEYYVVVHYLSKGNQPGFFMTNVEMPVKSEQLLFHRFIFLCNNLCKLFIAECNAHLCSYWASNSFLAYNRICDFWSMFEGFIRKYSTSKLIKKSSSAKTCQKHLLLICFISLDASFKRMNLN